MADLEELKPKETEPAANIIINEREHNKAAFRHHIRIETRRLASMLSLDADADPEEVAAAAKTKAGDKYDIFQMAAAARAEKEAEK